MACDGNGEKLTTLVAGEYECASVAGGVLYVGGKDGYAQALTL